MMMPVLRQAGRALAAGLLLSWLSPGTALAAELPALDPPAFRQLLQAQEGQVVLVNFWASWCRPCLKEIPVLQALEAEHRDEGFRLLLVALDEPDDYAGVLQPFTDKWFPGLKSHRRATADMDELVSVLDPAWNELLPTSYVLDRGGAVRARLQGGKSAAEFAAAIAPWLGGEQGAAPSR
jgi:thiol-disulfide isomerase/thioredoxin